MPTIRLGLVLPTEYRDQARRASLVADLDRTLALAAGHFDSAWMVDHLQFGDIDVLEGFTALTYLCARHPRLRFGNAVLCQSFRNPALLAKMAATLQFLSGGRFILGLGAGWHEEEYTAYGYPFPSAGVRVEQLEEAVQIIRLLWSQETATFSGRHYRVAGARCQPRPQPAPPIMIGAFQPRMLGLAARRADWWNVSSTSLASYRPMVERFNAACVEAGRGPATVRRTWIGGCACATTTAEAVDLTEGRWSADDDEDFGFVGTPDPVLEQMQPFMALGVDTFMFDCAGFPELTTLEMLIGEVAPRLADLAASRPLEG